MSLFSQLANLVSTIAIRCSAAVLVAACQAVIPDKGEADNAQATAVCRSGELDNFIGEQIDSDTIRGFEQPVRIISSGQAITMDYSADRINLEVDKLGIIIAAFCG